MTVQASKHPTSDCSFSLLPARMLERSMQSKADMRMQKICNESWRAWIKPCGITVEGNTKYTFIEKAAIFELGLIAGWVGIYPWAKKGLVQFSLTIIYQGVTWDGPRMGSGIDKVNKSTFSSSGSLQVSIRSGGSRGLEEKYPAWRKRQTSLQGRVSLASLLNLICFLRLFLAWSQLLSFAFLMAATFSEKRWGTGNDQGHVQRHGDNSLFMLFFPLESNTVGRTSPITAAIAVIFIIISFPWTDTILRFKLVCFHHAHLIRRAQVFFSTRNKGIGS